jgi:hypothetical protein
MAPKKGKLRVMRMLVNGMADGEKLIAEQLVN